MPFNRDRDSPLLNSSRLRDYKNQVGRYYEENHLEEWIARCPTALFASERVELIASQNYAHLPKKVDLLFAGEHRQFYVVEAKIEQVAENGGVVPYSIYDVQMKDYVGFLVPYLQKYPVSHQAYYARFSERFHDDRRRLDEDLRANPEDKFTLTEVYLTEGYDDYALDYLTRHSAKDDRKIRLTYYRFYPSCHCIEFWEIPLPEENITCLSTS